MASGHVKWFNDAKGFGFIIPDDQTGDVFVHFSSIVGQSGRRTLQEGDKVDYVAVEGPRGGSVESRLRADERAPGHVPGRTAARGQAGGRRWAPLAVDPADTVDAALSRALRRSRSCGPEAAARSRTVRKLPLAQLLPGHCALCYSRSEPHRPPGLSGISLVVHQRGLAPRQPPQN